MENNVPNLDAMERADLWAFFARHAKGYRYQKLFPDGGEGTKTATKNLATFAKNLAIAKHCRLRGEISSALKYEERAEETYTNLPPFARW